MYLLTLKVRIVQFQGFSTKSSCDFRFYQTIGEEGHPQCLNSNRGLGAYKCKTSLM